MFYFVYKTTNNIDGKYYIGCHQTNDLNDGYLGSGKFLKRAIKKYGTDAFIREILFFFNNKEDMFAKEKELVNKDIVLSENTYNLKVGGSGGNPGIVGAFTGKKHSTETKQKIKEKASNKIISEHTREKMSNNSWAKTNVEKHKEHVCKLGLMNKSFEHRKKISESMIAQGVQDKIKCPHCSKVGGARLMKRWHYNNCKSLSVRENGNSQVSKTLRTQFDSEDRCQ